MKRLLYIVASVLFASLTTHVFSAVQPTPAAAPPVKPVVNHTPEFQYKMRLTNQTKLITIGVSKGKLTKQQEKDLRASIKTVRQQEASFKKSNSDHKLTPDQVSQLNTMLDKNSRVLGETPSSN